MAVVTEQTPGGGGRAVLGSYQKPRGGMCLDRKINVMLPCVLYDSSLPVLKKLYCCCWDGPDTLIVLA